MFICVLGFEMLANFLELIWEYVHINGPVGFWYMQVLHKLIFVSFFCWLKDFCFSLL